MAKLKAKEIQGMTIADIKEKIKESRKELVKLNAQIATGTVPKSPGEVRNVKKNIARMFTIKSQKEKEALNKPIKAAVKAAPKKKKEGE